MSCDLYRFYDVSGKLLYVGISVSSIRRLGEHKNGAAWFRDWHYLTRQEYPSRGEAEEAEKIAIIEEKPKFNIAHSPWVKRSKDWRSLPIAKRKKAYEQCVYARAADNIFGR